MSDSHSITTLPSGLTILTERMDRVETISFGAYIGAGTRHETAAENGVAHFLEHMAFKGTASRSAIDIAEAIENVGGHINAYTSREQTAYYVKLLKEDLALGVDIIGDILCHSSFEPEELERERGVILQEIGQANDTPDDIIFDHFQSAAYPSQPMGRPVLGTEAIIRGMKRDALPGFMNTHYTPENMVIAASGNLHHEQVVELVQNHFADLPKAQPEQPMPADYTGGEYRELRDLDQAHIVLGFDSPGYGEPDYYPAMLLSTLLGGGMSSRLFQEVREQRGLAYAIDAYADTHEDVGVLGVYAGTAAKDAGEAAKVAAAELMGLAQGLREGELDRAKAQLKGAVFMARESALARAEQAASQILLFDRLMSTAEIAAEIDAVTPADIARVGQRLLEPRRCVAAVLGPKRSTTAAGGFQRALFG
jgi:predicted Zn-dependent peptidase